MTTSSISVKERLLEAIESLREDQQIDVLAYIERRKKLPVGITGKEAIEIARAINFPPEDLAEIAAAIEMHEEIADNEDISLDDSVSA